MISKLEKLRPNFQARELRRIIPRDCRILLDVGCGENSVARHISGIDEKIGIDIFPEAVKKSKESGIHNKYFCDDVRKIGELFQPKSIDCVMAMDLVEHLDKQEALDLIGKMEKIGKKVVIIQTTNGFFPQGEYASNPCQVHKCGFSVKDFRSRGYKVLGMDGPKFLRKKSFSEPEAGMAISILANLLDPIFRFIPEKSFNLLAYKKL